MYARPVCDREMKIDVADFGSCSDCLGVRFLTE